jgi:hypothetical protein
MENFLSGDKVDDTSILKTGRLIRNGDLHSRSRVRPLTGYRGAI